ncbi:MAG: hypothetical protein AB1814_00370 [Thermodesulfobacteriota bacterium]
MEQKTVEIEAGFANKPLGERELLFVDIPSETPADQVEAEARKAFEHMVASWNTPYVFRGVRRVLKATYEEDENRDQGGW